MTKVQASYSQTIPAAPKDVYAVLADYQGGHRAIVPKSFNMTIEKGGYGAGTIVLTKVTVWGRTYTYHQAVTEPEPGRLLVETEMTTGQFSSFTLEPVNGGMETKVTIHSEETAQPGLIGWMAQFTQPMIMRAMYKTELNNLAAYMTANAHSRQSNPI